MSGREGGRDSLTSNSVILTVGERDTAAYQLPVIFTSLEISKLTFYISVPLNTAFKIFFLTLKVIYKILKGPLILSLLT